MSELLVHCGGMVSPVGLDLASSCAAMRGGLDAFRETRFRDGAGEWILGAEIDLDGEGFGIARLKHALVMAIEEALGDDLRTSSSSVALLLCVSEPSRSEVDGGRMAEAARVFITDVQARLGLEFHPLSTVLPRGRIGGLEAIRTAAGLLTRGPRQVIVAGVDSYLDAATLSGFEKRRRLKTAKHSDGFIPGEAASAIIVSYRPLPSRPLLSVLGMAFATERATVESGEPLRAEGLTAALREALALGGIEMADVGYRVTTVNGESYYFREAALAMSRVMRRRSDKIIDLWHPADSIGDTGAASAVVCANVAAMAAAKSYASGPLVVLHASNDDEGRAVMLLGPQTREARS